MELFNLEYNHKLKITAKLQSTKKKFIYGQILLPFTRQE